MPDCGRFQHRGAAMMLGERTRGRDACTPAMCVRGNTVSSKDFHKLLCIMSSHLIRAARDCSTPPVYHGRNVCIHARADAAPYKQVRHIPPPIAAH